MADLRFQFLINGEVVCTAGVEGLGVFSSNLTWVKRSAESYARAKAEAPPDWDCTEEEWMREDVHINAGGRDSKYSGGASWFLRDLAVGDEITIRILGPGPTDTPEIVRGPMVG